MTKADEIALEVFDLESTVKHLLELQSDPRYRDLIANEAASIMAASVLLGVLADRMMQRVAA